MRYFFHVITIGLFALSAMFQSWPIALCAVVTLALIAGREGLEVYLTSKREVDLQKSVAAVLEDNKKLRDEITKMQGAVGAMNYKVQQMSHYVGAPEN